MQLAEVTTYDIQEYLKHKKSIIIPFAATEQHSHHLPMGTDTFIAEMMAKEVGNISKTMVAPVISIGFSPGLHPHFAGTISLKATTFILVIQDILTSLLNAGFQDFLLLNAHGLNESPLKTALLDFLNEHNARAIVTNYWELDKVQSLREEGDGIHCTIQETSMMLYLKSELVDMKKAVNEYKKARFFLGKEYIRQISTSGVIAETKKSTAEKGKQIYQTAVDGILRLLENFDSETLFE